MQEFFLKHKKRIIGAGIAILVLVTVIASGIKLNATLLESAIGVVVTPFQDLTTGISSWIDDTVTSARNKTKLKDENQELKQQIAELTNKNRRLSMYETENERLTALLKIAQKYPSYDSVGARVIAKDPGIWYDGFTINKGTTSSISANMVLIAPEGLVGKVLESGATFSKAQSILDSRSSVPAMSVRTGDLGVVKGNYSLANHGLCKMEYIDGDAEIMVGDEIVTSQLSDIYPEGLAIGKVLEIETDTNGLTKYAVIEPYVDLKHLDTVLVLDKGAKQSGKSTAKTNTQANPDAAEPTHRNNIKSFFWWLWCHWILSQCLYSNCILSHTVHNRCKIILHSFSSPVRIILFVKNIYFFNLSYFLCLFVTHLYSCLFLTYCTKNKCYYNHNNIDQQ